MKDSLKSAQQILLRLENEIERMHSLWTQLQQQNPDWSVVSEQQWLDKRARCLIHGATELRETNALEQWLFDNPPLSEMAKDFATESVRCWKEWLEITEAYYEYFDDFSFPKPHKKESLRNFLVRMAKLVEAKGFLKGFRSAPGRAFWIIYGNFLKKLVRSLNKSFQKKCLCSITKSYEPSLLLLLQFLLLLREKFLQNCLGDADRGVQILNGLRQKHWVFVGCA